MSSRRVRVTDNLPLYWRVADRETVSPLSLSRAPFTFGIDPSGWRLRQEMSVSLGTLLKEIYLAEANIGLLQPESSLGKPYLDDLIHEIQRVLVSRNLREMPRRILEVGCGACQSLISLRKAGHDVVGVDPSPIAARWAETLDIEVLQTFFGSDLFSEEFDLTFGADVLEHVEEPINFLRDMIAATVPGGLVLVAVPDCTFSVRSGDISIAMHQHLNYFTTSSLMVALQLAGLRDVEVRNSNYGGSLYGIGRKTFPGETPLFGSQISGTATYDLACQEVTTFLATSPQRSADIQLKFKSILDVGQSCAFYAPVRALPYLADILDAVPAGSIRLVDDTESWHRKFIDGCDVEIENFSDIAEVPPNHVFIMSLTFERILTEKVARLKSRVGSITTLRSLLETS